MNFLTSWILSGFISAIIACLCGMRGRPFDENYFNKNNIRAFLRTVIYGYISILIIIYMFIFKKYKPFTHLLYKIANIGIKKNKKEQK